MISSDMKRMKCILVAVGVCLGAAVGGGGVVGRPPRTRLAREVIVLQWGLREVLRVRRPGVYELELPCSHAAGGCGRMALEIVAKRVSLAPTVGYRDCTFQEVMSLAAGGKEVSVRFWASLGGLDAVKGTSGEWLFQLEGGLLCVVKRDDVETQRQVRAVPSGEEVLIRGRTGRTLAGQPCVFVEGLGPAGRGDEPPWEVTVRWGGEGVARLERPGDYPFRLPCLRVGGAVEEGLVRLREFRVVDLWVGGHHVWAELADTPEARSWGLQGRARLEPDEGMLFVFDEPLRPTFVMKTVSFPISLAFIRPDGTIVNIEHMDPGDFCGVTSTEPVSYVLEISRGWFEQHGVKPGAEVRFP